MQTVTNIFIANMAFADVILGIFTIPFQFQTIILGRWEVAYVKNVSEGHFTVQTLISSKWIIEKRVVIW
jgi:hypothetical protein